MAALTPRSLADRETKVAGDFRLKTVLNSVGALFLATAIVACDANGGDDGKNCPAPDTTTTFVNSEFPAFSGGTPAKPANSGGYAADKIVILVDPDASVSLPCDCEDTKFTMFFKGDASSAFDAYSNKLRNEFGFREDMHECAKVQHGANFWRWDCEKDAWGHSLEWEAYYDAAKDISWATWEKDR
ncbi:MAG: hypothetical protein LBU73_09300 [Helicobacteraceae bacterium]|jgi:hypothetical protein|nr:hypothetical protein [Helicobacteraceae bacterium]